MLYCLIDMLYCLNGVLYCLIDMLYCLNGVLHCLSGVLCCLCCLKAVTGAHNGSRGVVVPQGLCQGRKHVRKVLVSCLPMCVCGIEAAIHTQIARTKVPYLEQNSLDSSPRGLVSAPIKCFPMEQNSSSGSTTFLTED